MDRQSGPQTVSVAVGVGTTAAFVNEKFAGGLILPQTGWTGLTSFTFTVCDTVDGTYVPLLDDSGVAVSVTVTPGSASPLPDEVSLAPFFKAVGNVVVPAGSAKTVTCMLKS